MKPFQQQSLSPKTDCVHVPGTQTFTCVSCSLCLEGFTPTALYMSPGDTHRRHLPACLLSVILTNLGATLLWLQEMTEEILHYNLLLMERGNLLEFVNSLLLVERGGGEGKGAKELSTHWTNETGAVYRTLFGCELWLSTHSCTLSPICSHCLSYFF